MSDFVADYLANERILTDAGVDTTPHDACGVGLVAALDGKPRRDVVVAFGGGVIGDLVGFAAACCAGACVSCSFPQRCCHSLPSCERGEGRPDG